MNHKIFVYGTLKQNNKNHMFFLHKNNASFINEAITKENNFILKCNGFYPMVKQYICSENSLFRIKGEIYEVDEFTLNQLDLLESNGFLYTRELKEFEIVDDNKIKNVKAWIYLYNDNIDEWDIRTPTIKCTLDIDHNDILEWNHKQHIKGNNMTKTKENIQFHYIQDLDTPERILTFATQKISQDVFKVAYAVNRVEEIKQPLEYKEKESGMVVNGIINGVAFDPFSKKLARKIVKNRLASKNSVMVYVNDSTVRRAVLETLADSMDVPVVVNKIAQQRLYDFKIEEQKTESGKGTD